MDNNTFSVTDEPDIFRTTCAEPRPTCSGLAGGLPFVARVALLACIGGLAFVVCSFVGFLL